MYGLGERGDYMLAHGAAGAGVGIGPENLTDLTARAVQASECIDMGARMTEKHKFGFPPGRVWHVPCYCGL